MNKTIADYTISRLLGQGGMAEVYEGLDPALDRPVAVKLIHPRLAVDAQFEERFRREARLVAGLRHPHIVQVYDYQVTADGPVMVMEYLPGGSLKDRLDDLRSRGERMALPEAARIVDALASALDYAHRRGAVHRDVKPANVLFDREGAPVLADFGIARILDDEIGLTQPGTIIGTPAYLSPEQAAGEIVSPASDLYSLGVVLYELVSGAPPFQGTTTAILTSHASATPPPLRSRLPHLPAAVDQMVQQALAKRPADRFPSGAALAQAFRAAIGAQPAAAPDLTDQPTLIEGSQVPAAALPSPPSSQADGASTEQPAGQMARLAEQLEILSPLIGHSIPEAYRDGRSRLASTLGLVGLLFALLKFATDFLNLAEKAWRPIGLAVQSLPVLVGILLLAGAGSALVALRRPNRLLNRQRALGLFAGLALTGLVWSAWTVAQWLRPPDKLIVAIGEFERFSSRVGNPAGDLFVAMERAFAPLQERVSIQRTWRTYASAAEAKADGVARGAVALLWGSYSDDGVTVYLEAMDPPAQTEIGGVTLSLQQFSGLAQRMGLNPAAPAGQLGRFQREPLYIPDRVSFAAAETAQMTAAAAAVLGVSFQLAGDPETALALLDQAAVGLGEGDGELVGAEMVYFQRGVLRWEAGQQEEAIGDMERALSFAPDFYPARYNLSIFYASGCATPARLTQAVGEAESAARLRPADNELRHLLASLYLQVHRPEDALAILQASANDALDDPDYHLLLAQVYSGLGQQREATAAVEQAVALLQQTPSAEPARLLTLGNAYVLAERYNEALDTYRLVNEAAPENAGGWRGLGDAHFWLRDWSAATAAYTKVAELQPEQMDGYLLLGLTAAMAEDRGAAIAALSQAAQRTTCDPTPALLLGGQHILQEEYAEAVQALGQALAIDPENADALYLLGSSYAAQEDWSAAAESYGAAVAIRSDDSASLWGLATALSATGRDAEASDAWQRYTALDPGRADGWQNLALALLLQQRYPEAEAAARSGLNILEGEDFYVTLGMALDGQGQDAEALEAFGEALALNPDATGAYRGIGMIFKRYGKIEEAISAFDKAVALGGTAQDYTALAGLYQQTGQIVEGLAAAEKALRAMPENGDALLRAALLQREAGNWSSAEKLLQQAAAQSADDPFPHFWLGQIAYQQCRLSTAAQALKQAVDLAPTPLFYSALAAVYLAQGRDDEVEMILADLRAAPGDDAEAHTAAARLLVKLDQLDEALAAYQLAVEAASPGSLTAALLPYELGTLHLLLGQILPARSEFQRALDILPSLAPAQAALGDAALWQGAMETALDHYAAAVAAIPAYRYINPDRESMDVFLAATLAKEALALRALNRTDDATEKEMAASQLAAELLAIGPQNPTAHFALGVVDLLNGKPAEADAAFAQAIQCDASLAIGRFQAEKMVQQFQD